MSSVAEPVPVPDEAEAFQLRVRFHSHPVVDLAERQLRDFIGDMDAVTASRLLPMWRGYGQLSAREARAVIARFAAPSAIAQEVPPELALDPAERAMAEAGGSVTATCRASGCGGPIELVPTPAGSDPDAHRPYWRHMRLSDLDRPHPATPDRRGGVS